MDLAPGFTDVRVAVPVAAAWVCAALLVGAPGIASGVLVGATVLTAASIVLLVRCGGLRVVLGLTLAASALCGLVAVAVLVGDGRRNPAALEDRGPGAVPVSIVLGRDLVEGDRSVLGTLERAGDVDGLRVPVRLVPAGGGGSLSAGSTVQGSATLEPDAQGSATSYVAFVRGATVDVPPTGLLAATDRSRQAFVAATRALPEPGASLLRGLAIGDRSGLDAATEAAMEASALTHLTAVSGANCAVIVGLVVVCGRALGLPRVARAGVAIMLLLAFVVLVRPDPSIVRATVMAVVVLVVHSAGRPVRGVPLIALAAIGMLVVDPWYSRSFAFALSVLATSGIVVLGPPLTTLFARRLWTPLAAVLAVPVAAQLACWPVTIPLSAALPTYAVPANLLTEPLAPIVTVVGLAACLTAPIWPWGASVLSAVAWVPATAIGGVAHGVAGLPYASAPWPGGVGGVVAAGLVSASLAVAVLVPRPVGIRLLLLAGVVVLIGILVVAVPRLVVQAGLPDDWAVAACDVGQGDAVLLRGGGPGVALVDTGDDPERLGACLDLLGIDRIDLLVLTHFDRDHVGAVDVVADRVTTALVGPVGRPEDERVVRTLQRAGVDVRQVDDSTSGALDGLRWRVVWPRAGARDAGNDASLVLRTSPDDECTSCVSSLLLGDLGESAQRRARAAVAAGIAGSGAVDVVKVAHHGSADQDPVLYRQVAAPVGLIGVGADNTYGHPTRSALRMLADAGTAAYRTDEHGTVVVARADDGALRVWTERSESAVARRIEAWPPRNPLAPARRSTRCRGRGSVRRPWCSSPAPRRSWPSARAVCSVTSSSAKTRRSRCTTSKPTSTPPACWRHSRAPRCSGNPGSSG